MAYDAANNTSALSTGATVTTPTAPSAPTAPTGLSATSVSSSQINLAWQASSGSPSSYDIYRNGAKVASISAVNVSYGDSGLAANTTYSYYVIAVNSVGSSPRSTTASATTQATTSSTGSLQGVIKNTQGSAISSATITLSFNGGNHTYVANSSGSYTITAIPTGTYATTYAAKKYASQHITVGITANITTQQNVTLIRQGGKR
jgi:hypothetical protein